MLMTSFHKKISPVLFAVLASAAILAGGKYLYFILYLMLLVIVIPWIRLKISLKSLSGSIEPESVYAEVGQTVTVRYLLKNHSSGRFPYLELAGSLDSSLQVGFKKRTVCLEAGEQAVFTVQFSCARKGIYALNSFQVKTGDPFGLFQLSKTLAAEKEIRVYPQVKPLSVMFPQARRHFGSLRAVGSQLENYSQYSDLREWRKGDSRKKIHWKQSARQDRLLVKNYEQKGDVKINILLDMAAKSYDHKRREALEDLAVDAAAALLAQNLKYSIPVEVFSQSLSSGSLAGQQPRDYWAIMDLIITVASSSKTAFDQFVKNCSYHLSAGSTLYLITPFVDHLVASGFVQLHYEGFQLFLLYLADEDPPAESVELIEKLREAGVRVYYSTAARSVDDQREAL